MKRENVLPCWIAIIGNKEWLVSPYWWYTKAGHHILGGAWGVLVNPGVDSTKGLDYFPADSGAMPFGLSLRKIKVTDPSKKLG
jgi:hypothetical protein